MKKAIEFSVAVCLISWLFAIGIYFIADGKAGSIAYNLLAMIYMLIPMCVAMLLQKFRYKEIFRSTGLLNFRITGKWFLAWIFIPAVITLSIALSTVVPGVDFSWEMEGFFAMIPAEQQDIVNAQLNMFPRPALLLIMITGGMLAGITINAAFAFGEEYGWRNFLVSALKRYKFWQVCLFSGFIWGIWHFPLILMGHNYPTAPGWGVPMMVWFCMLLTPSMLYFTLKTRSVAVAAIMHGTLNALWSMAVVLLIGGNNFNTGILGFPGFAAIIIATFLLYLYDKCISKENIFTKTVIETIEQ